MSGKANLKIFEFNARGGATIYVSKVSAGEFMHVKTLGLNVIKYLLDGIMNGSIKEEDFEKYKKKNEKVAEEKLSKGDVVTCEICDRELQTTQGLKLHKTRMHKNTGAFCDKCAKTFNDETEVNEHIKIEHVEISSPKAKKRKHIVDIESLDEKEDDNDIDENLETLERKSWEEIRLTHREIEVQVNENEVDNMEDYSVDDRNVEMKKKLSEKHIGTREAQNDEKVLLKQLGWFEEEMKFQEIKRMTSEDKSKNEKKRKSQVSKGKKKKKSKLKKETFKEKDFKNLIIFFKRLDYEE